MRSAIPLLPAALSAGAESAEQVEVGQHPVELVDGETSGVVVLARSGAWQVQRAGAWVGSEPAADMRQVTASPAGGESEGVADLRAGDALRVEREVGEEFDVERLAVGDGLASPEARASTGPSRISLGRGESGSDHAARSASSSGSRSATFSSMLGETSGASSSRSSAVVAAWCS